MAARKKKAAAKKKRAYTRRKKSGGMSAVQMEGYQAGLTFAHQTLATKDGDEFLTGHEAGVKFVVKNGAPKPRKKKRAAYGTRKKKAAAK